MAISYTSSFFSGFIKEFEVLYPYVDEFSFNFISLFPFSFYNE